MKIEVYPSTVSGVITLPASKSILHRAIISAALSVGKTIINNVIYSEDVVATIEAFKQVGVTIEKQLDSLVVTSLGISNFKHGCTIDCNESGSTLRFLIPVLTNKTKTVFKGKSTLFKRPMSVYKDIFLKNGLYYNQDSKSIETKGNFSSGIYIIPGNISSQFITGLLFILPILEGDSVIQISGELESANYVDMTIDILDKFGVLIIKQNNNFIIKGNQQYIPTVIKVETDYSQLAFFAVLGMVNKKIKANNINQKSLQPDKQIINIIKSMHGNIEINDDIIVFNKSDTIGRIIDVSQCPDIAPILGILAACSKGQTHIINAKRLIMKESNRLLSTYTILKKLGVTVLMNEDSLHIEGAPHLKGNIFDSFNDHRIAMSLAIAGTIATSKVTIEHAEVINKSYPNFYKDLQSLGVKIKYIEAHYEKNKY